MASSPNDSLVLALDPAVLLRNVGDETVVCDPAAGLAHVVNESACQILLAYRPGRTVLEAISALASRYEIAEKTLAESVREVTTHMVELGLLKAPDPLIASDKVLKSQSQPAADKSPPTPRYLYDPPSR